MKRVRLTDRDGDAYCDNCQEVKSAVIEVEQRLMVCEACIRGWLQELLNAVLSRGH